MSIWADIQDRSTGKLEKKEDHAEEENLWGVYFTDNMKTIADMMQTIDDDIQDYCKHNTELGRSIKKLQERIKGLY